MNISTFPRRALAVFAVLATMALPAMLPSAANATDDPVIAPENPAFVDYINHPEFNVQQVMDMNERSYFMSGLVPEPVDLSHMEGWQINSDAPTILSAPSFYDLRTTGKLTAVRDQGSCGSCWSFATYGSLESSLMPAENWDFSENNLKNLSGFDIACCSGGNRTMSTAYLARWQGPVAEADDRYNAGSCASPVVAPKKHVQQVIYLPTRSGPLDNENLKQAVMTFGAVYTTYYHSNSYYNSSTRSYYYPGGGQSNHAVCIVGWDDSYPRSRFSTTPPGDGAFLIRNSWGSWWGDSGYFWMSYYDNTLGRSENAVFRAEPATNYNAIYQYDQLGWISSAGYGTTNAWFANVFTATSNGYISAASWYSGSPNASYTLYVYVNPTSGPIGPAPAATKSGTLTYAGYNTVALDSGVPVSAGQKFSVVVQLNTPGYGYPIPLERPYSGYASKATASAGQSYMSSNGTAWTDVTTRYANANVCLKAFASSSSGPGPGPDPDPDPEPTPGALAVSPATTLTSSGNVGGPFSPSSQSYTLSNTGQTSISWTASKSAPWVSLSSTSGTLSPGASATVSVSINTAANSLAAGSYSDSVAFVNTTNGAGNTTRSVSLTVKAAAKPGTLAVSPADGFESTGPVRGPFSPTSKTYTLTNTGTTSISWSATRTQYWTNISPTGGTLAAGASVNVTVSLNYYASYMSQGTYNDTVTFRNSTNGNGNTTRPVKLTIGSAPAPNPGALSVSPAGAMTSTGSVGGPFTPSTAAYTLTNTGGSAITWTARSMQSWTTLSSTGGSLNPGASAIVTVYINSGANSLSAGNYTDTITFTNTTNGAGNTTRTVNLSVTPGGGSSGQYRIVPEAYYWIDPSTHSKMYASDNSVSIFYMPFSFDFYGTAYNRIYVGSNGLMGFINSSLTYNTNTDIPHPYYPNAAIYPYWDDLNPSMGGSVRIATVGTAPNRKLVVSWVDVPHKASTAIRFTFQVVLCEGSNDIIFQYANVSPTNPTYGGGRSATIGIENATGNEACKHSFNKINAVTNGTALRFTRQSTTYGWRTGWWR